MQHDIKQRLVCRPKVESYLFNLMAEQLLTRIPLFHIQPKAIAVIGASTAILRSALTDMFPDADIVCFNSNFSLQQRQYDLILHNATIAWYLDPQVLLQAIHAALKMNGLFLFTTLGPDTLISIQQAARDAFLTPRTSTFVDMHDWGDVLSQTGFDDAVVDRFDMHIAYRKVAQWFDDWRAWGLIDPSPPACKGLITPRRWRAMLDSVKVNKDDDWHALFECIQGHAWVMDTAHARVSDKGEISMSVEDVRSAIKKSNSSR